MKDVDLLKWLNDAKNKLSKMDEHYDSEVEVSLTWIIESIDEAIFKVATLIDEAEDRQEAQLSYNEILLEQNAINMGMNRL